jgi:hypothetical protein
MATFYQGYRNIIKGRDSDNSIHEWKGTAGVYSNWSLMNSDHPLDGVPNNHRALGASRLSEPTFLELLFSGAHHIAPINNVGGGTRLDGFRWGPHEYKGMAGTKAFRSGFGHADRSTSYSLYSNHIFDGIEVAKQLSDSGHAIRYTAAWGGASKPHIHQGVTTAMASDYGQAIPAGHDNAYGRNRVNEWRGVPSARAL